MTGGLFGATVAAVGERFAEARAGATRAVLGDGPASASLGCPRAASRAASRSTVIRVLAWVTVPAASVLTFALQPVAGKHFLPVFGGTAGAWLTQVFYFPVMLFLGYLLANWAVRLPSRVQWLGLGGLGVLSVVVVQLPPVMWAAQPSLWTLLGELAVSFTPFLLFSTSAGIVLHGWLEAEEGRVPYYLYGLSNLGSLLSLLLYPFVIEPHLGLAAQGWILRGAHGVAVAGVIGIAVALARRGRDVRQAGQAAEPLPWARLGAWVVLAFLTNVVMLGATTLLAAELGSNPLTWLLPLGLYLVSFTVTFAAWRTVWVVRVGLLGFLGACGVYGLMHGVEVGLMTGWAMLVLLIAVLFGCVFGNGLLFVLRPARRFGLFYVLIAVGGLLAGLFSSVVAPAVLDRNIDFHLGAIALLVAGVCLMPAAVARVRRRVLLGAAGVVLAGLAVVQWVQSSRDDGSSRHFRNHYGYLQMSAEDNRRRLANASTVHGEQFLAEDQRRVPTLYYSERSSMGALLRVLQQGRTRVDVGVIGMGIGTLAAYNRPGDRMVFWEINPLVTELARKPFTFLADAEGTVEVYGGDGRLGLKGTGPFDALIVDAFSGDAVPVHLLTREAFALYAQETPGGLVVCHISNRYVNLFAVIEAAAAELGWRCMEVTTAVEEARATVTSIVALVYAPEARPTVDRLLERLRTMGGGGINYYARPGQDKPSRQPWTDDRHAIIDVIEWDLLFAR